MQKYASIRNGLAEKDSYTQQKRKDKDFQLSLQVIQVIYWQHIFNKWITKTIF